MTHSFFINLSLITLKRLFFDGQSQNRYRKLVDVVVCSNNICTKAFYRYIVHSSTCLGPR